MARGEENEKGVTESGLPFVGISIEKDPELIPTERKPMTIQLKTTGAEGYENLIEQFLASAFPVVGIGSSSVLESVMSAILTSGQLRYGPLPSPESQVAMREVVRYYIENDRPIPILIPFGSRKAVIGESIDVAEVMALKQLAALQERVQSHYEPGTHIVLKLEDLTGNYMFDAEPNKNESVISTDRYCTDMQQLARILGMYGPNTFLNIRRESLMSDPATLSDKIGEIYPSMLEYLQRSDGVEDSINHISQMRSWENLKKIGWRGQIPRVQRQYYYDRYKNLDPSISQEETHQRLARYLSCSWARAKLNIVGDLLSWGGKYLKISFCPPVPGVPEGLTSRTVYYRTLALKHAQTHIPPWRAKGYLLFDDNGPRPKLTSWRDNKQFMKSSVEITDGDNSVHVQTDFIIS